MLFGSLLSLNGGPASVFTEQSAFTTTADLLVDVTVPGTYTANPVGTGINFTAGQLIDSYYLHYDVSGTGVTTGSLVFDTDVLAIIGDVYNLENSHGQLGAAGTTYWISNNLHGLWDSANDSITLSADRRTIDFTFRVGSAIDSVRILTVASSVVGVPEPATGLFVALGLVALLRRRLGTPVQR